jgi:lipopolysaccharide transport system permease protein
LAGLLDFSIAFIVLIGMMRHFHIYPTVLTLLLPLLPVMLTASSAGMVLTALNAKYSDIRYSIPFLVSLWMFLSPIVYPPSTVPQKYRLFYDLNPMVGVVEGFRSALGHLSWIEKLSITRREVFWLSCRWDVGLYESQRKEMVDQDE